VNQQLIYNDVMNNSPQKLTITFFDHLKSLVNWLFIFRFNLAYPPGLYFTGNTYNKNTPLIVSCNFLLTVFLLYYRLKNSNVRILVIDTKGVNVWCSAGKGQFSSETILSSLAQYDTATIGEQSELILPKLSLSGVKLSVLRKARYKPIIGPIYMRDIPQFLKEFPRKQCFQELLRYDLKDRTYIMVPSIVQFSKYIIGCAMVFFIMNKMLGVQFPTRIFIIAISIVCFYQLLFPWLWGQAFVTKGLVLATILSCGLVYEASLTGLPLLQTIFNIVFTFATSIFFALYYTGNSGVSNYSRVKQEIIKYIPVSFVLYIMAVIVFILHEVRV